MTAGETRTVAVLAASPALTSVLSAVLSGAASLRVRRFESQRALVTYMRIAPVHLVVLDFDCTEAPAGRVASVLRADQALMQRQFQIIAMTRRIEPGAREAATAAGIDEVMVKPMSPRYLLERVLSRLKLAAAGIMAAPDSSRRLPVRDFRAYGDNIIPLFGPRLGHQP